MLQMGIQKLLQSSLPVLVCVFNVNALSEAYKIGWAVKGDFIAENEAVRLLF